MPAFLHHTNIQETKLHNVWWKHLAGWTASAGRETVIV